jgi:zinc protease
LPEYMTEGIRRTPPPPLAPVQFNIPKAHAETLDNGLKVVIFEESRLPIVSYRLAFRSGDAADPADAVGITSAAAAMLTEGTEDHSSAALAEKIERLGASLSANSSDDFTIISASTLALYNSEILSLIAEVVFRPTFPENELDLYRRNTIEHLKFQRSQPGFLAGEQVARLVYGDHPYSRVAPKAEDIEKLNRDALAEHHSRVLIPNNAVLVVVGDVDRGSILKEINDHFGEWQPGTVETLDHSPSAQLKGARLTIVDRPASAQSNIVLANAGIARSDPDYFPVLVMNQVLGAGASSRVFMNLREEKGYTYGAYTRFDAKRFAGDFEATAEVRTAVTGDSLKEFFYELRRIRDDEVSAQELIDAKNFLTGVFPIRAETQEGLTNLIVTQELYELPDDYLQTYRENVAAITAEDVRRVAGRLIDPDHMAIVIVGDARDILAQAGEYAADVEVFDTDGNALDAAQFTSTTEPADISGNWKLSLDFQGQQVPVTLKIDQFDGNITGTLETVLGSGEISSGSVRGNSFSATANTDIQGQSVEFLINGSLEDQSMKGTISAPIIPDSLAFTGMREATQAR